MAVRRLDWGESLRLGAMALSAAPSEALTCTVKNTAPAGGPGTAPTASDASQCNTFHDMPSEQAASALGSAASVPLHERFEAIIGTDVMYEPPHAALVAAVIAHRLPPGGACLLSCGVRECAIFDAFAAQCVARRLRYRHVQVDVPPNAGDASGIFGRSEDYEGGFRLIAIDHRDAPCTSWHRNDFVEP